MQDLSIGDEEQFAPITLYKYIIIKQSCEIINHFIHKMFICVLKCIEVFSC